jgi:hypothetical protein
MVEFDSTTAWKDRAFYFCGKLEQPVVAKIWHFRSEREYDTEPKPEFMAMTLVRSFAKCLGKPPILILFSDVGSPSAMRSKKGVLWEHKVLRQLPHIAFEIECGHGDTRLGAIVDLSDFSFDSSASAILNWGRGLIVLSNDSLSDLKQLVEQWASKDTADVLAFDYDAIASSIQQNTALGLLRYLPPSNSRLEAIVVVGEEHFVDEGACECIDSIM